MEVGGQNAHERLGRAWPPSAERLGRHRFSWHDPDLGTPPSACGLLGHYTPKRPGMPGVCSPLGPALPTLA